MGGKGGVPVRRPEPQRARILAVRMEESREWMDGIVCVRGRGWGCCVW